MRTLGLSLLLSTTACVLSPYNGDGYAPGQAIDVSGYWHQPNSDLFVEASPTRYGTYATVGEARTGSSAVVLDDGTEWYHYSVSVVVPPELWTGDACTGKETFIRVRGLGNVILWTFDQVAPDGKDPVDCMIEARERLGDTFQAAAACAAKEKLAARVEVPGSGAPFDHVGDVTIATQADQAQWVCLRSLEGTLSVPDSSLPLVELPVLESVSGNVELAYSRPGLKSTEKARRIWMPALTTIEGHLDLDSPAALPNQRVTVDLGLNGLEQLEGDLGVDIPAFNVHLKGLSSLPQVGGNFSLTTGTGDTLMAGTLPNLAIVDGDAVIDLGLSTTLGVLPALQSVGGNFTHIDGGMYFQVSTSVVSYPQLTEVGGNFEVINVDSRDLPHEAMFKSLQSVGGTLRYEDIGPATRSAIAIGGSKLEVGGLVVEGNSALSMVGAEQFKVMGSGPIEFTTNPNLCTSSIQSFLTGQTQWTGGPAVLSGNAGC